MLWNFPSLMRTAHHRGPDGDGLPSEGTVVHRPGLATSDALNTLARDDEDEPDA